VAILSRARGRGDLDFSDNDSLAGRAKRFRMILGDLVEDIDPAEFAAELPPDPTLTEREAFRQSLPLLDPPLSATIAEEREDGL